MMSMNERNGNRSACHPNILYPFLFHDKINLKAVLRKMSWHGSIVILLILLSGCFHVPMSSKTTIHDPLQTSQSVAQEEVLVIFGENAPEPKQSIAGSYFTANCATLSQRDTIGELIKTILRINPHPGKFAVRPLKDLEKANDSNCMANNGDSILCRLNLSKTQVIKDRLRYAIHVKETFEAKIHIPLYASPFGVASCGNKTVLETTVWELPTEQRIGSFAVSAEGEYTVMAYLFHVIVYRNTQKDATERLAREIIEKLTGLMVTESQID